VIELLDHAEAVMEEHPDSAYQFLCEADSCVADQSRKTRMRHQMLMTEAKNKLDMPLPSNTLFQEVVDYYDDHGAPNQQLMVHYLLGRIYSDRGEAPMALQCYNDAVEKADTLSDDCDYTTLYKVYGQMADVFESQVMPDEEIDALKQYSKYALKAGNAYEYIRGIEFMAGAYDLKGDTAMILATEEKTHDLYKKYNMSQASARAYTISIHMYIAKGDYQKAHQLMQLFEKESGLFDEEGNIQKDREGYYLCKGSYYMGINKIDSAELYFKKLLNNPKHSFHAYRGLMRVSQKKGDASAVLAYSKQYEASFDTLITNIHATATRQVKGMYDYTRHQRIASEERMKSERRLNIIYAILLLVILVAAIIFQLYTKAKTKKMLEIRLLKQQLVNLSERYTRTEEELEMMGTDFATLKKKKEAELAELQQQLQEIQNKYGHILKDDFSSLLQSPFVAVIRKKTEIPGRIKPLTDKEKSELVREFQRYMPQLYARLANTNKLSKLEFYVVLLTRIGLQPDVITQLLDVASNSTSNARKKANNKLFADDTAYTLFDNLSRL
jgi:tetratricopeptide (TPR) repeat protein